MPKAANLHWPMKSPLHTRQIRSHRPVDLSGYGKDLNNRLDDVSAKFSELTSLDDDACKLMHSVGDICWFKLLLEKTGLRLT